jgi:hypothetical protein
MSKCCKAEVLVLGNDCMYYVCIQCNRPCDLIYAKVRYENLFQNLFCE